MTYLLDANTLIEAKNRYYQWRDHVKQTPGCAMTSQFLAFSTLPCHHNLSRSLSSAWQLSSQRLQSKYQHINIGRWIDLACFH